MKRKYEIHVRRRGRINYSITNWAADDIDKTLDNAKSIMETIEKDTIGEHAKYNGMYRFIGIEIYNSQGERIYYEERE